jgi:uncharacterized SAM-dependent methyltransferase
MDPDQINEMLAACYRNINIIEQDINALVFHMQGGLDFDDAFLLTVDQRRSMAKMIQKHYDDQNPNKKSQL